MKVMMKLKLPQGLSNFLSNMQQGLNNWISLRKSNWKKKETREKNKQIKKENRICFTMAITKESSHIVVLHNIAYRVTITVESIDVIDWQGREVHDKDLLIQILMRINSNGLF